MNQAEKFKRLTCTEAIRNDLRASSVRAAAFTGAAGAADFILRIGSTAILARLILPEHFGLVMMVTAVTAIADQFRDLGLSTATVQRKEISHREVSNLFWINLSAGLLIALVVCGASPFISSYYKEPRLTLLTCVLATNFICGGLMVQHQALLTRQLRLGHTSSVRLLSSVLSTVLAIALAWAGFGYWALIWREVVRSVLLTAGMWICFPWIPSLPCRKTDIRELLGFGAHLSVANIVATVSSSVDRILIGRFWGAGPVAIYRQAYQLLVVPMDQLLGPMFQVTQPGLSMLQTEDLRYRQFYQRVLTVVCVATMPLSLFVAVNSAEITRVVLGRKWLGSASILVILSLGTFIKAPVGWSAHILITRGKSKRYMYLTFLQNLTLIIFMLVGVHWGIAGVAAADAATTYLLAAPILYFSFKDSPVTLASFCSTITRPAIASIVMAVVLRGLRQTLPPLGAPAYLVLASLTALTVFFGIWMLLPGGKAELMAIVSDSRTALRRKIMRKNAVEPMPVALGNP
jgi:O-antigen/teichoic acid export membrane protein